jgi:ribosome-interacting GTPase 1
MVKNIFQEYKIHNAHVTFRGDHDVDELIDVIEGNRKYIQCLYVYNKIDTISIEEVDMLARSENTAVLSSLYKLGASLLLDRIWDMLSLVRVYTKKVDSNSKPIEGMRS